MVPPKVNKIGKYEILDVIGRGGMGQVYKAIDPTIGRMVAIKKVTSVFSDDPLLLKRFYREAHSTGKLQHPNIVTVYDLGDQDGVPYLVMEYLEGDSLEKVIKEQRPFSLAEKLNIITQVCEGLGYAHQRQIIHRDVKPGNVVVLNDGGVKIVDFGIAQLGNERFTQTGQVIGSLYYMSPEQIQGLDIDARSDIYSTGVLLFEFLAGVLPFQGKDPTSTLAKILQEPPPSLSNLFTACPPELDAVIQRALSKDRNNRYTAMEDFVFELQSVQEKLSRDVIAGCLRSAEFSMETRDWNKAREHLRQVLKFDKQHRRASELLREVQTQIQRQQISEQVGLLRSQADDALAARRWDDAVALLDQAVRLDGTNSEMIEFRNSVRRSSELLAEALRRAELAHGQGDLDTAKNAVQAALRVDPSDTTAKALLAIVSKEIAERSRRNKIDELITEARKEIALRRYTSALDILRQAEAVDPTVAEVHQLIRTATAGLEHELRRRALEDACSEIENLLNRDEYAAACTKADEAMQRFPEDLGLLKLRGFAEKQREAWTRRQFIEAQMTRARQVLDEGQLIRAQGILNEALERYPDDSGLTSLLATVTDGLARQETQRKEAERQEAEKLRYINLQLAAADELQRSGQTALALKKLLDALRHYPGNEELKAQVIVVEDLLKQEEDQRQRVQQEAQRKRAQVEREIVISQQLLGARQTDAAVAKLEQALRQYPESQELKSQLEFAQRRAAVEQAERERVEQQARRQRSEIEREVAKAQVLLDSRQASRAVATLERGLHQYPDSEELKSQLKIARQRVDIEQAEQERAAQEARLKQQQIERDLATARQLLDGKKANQAISSLEQALHRFPESIELKAQLEAARQRLADDEAEAQRMQRELRRRAAIEKGIAVALDLLDSDQTDQAVSTLEQALRNYPDSEELKSTLQGAQRRLAAQQAEREKAEREARRKQAEIDRELTASRQLLDAKQTSQAIASLEQALRTYPDAKELRAQLDLASRGLVHEREEKARAEELAARRRSEIEGRIQSAREFLEAKRNEQAIDALERATGEFPESAELRSLLATAEQRLKQEREEQAREAQVRKEHIAAALENAKRYLKSNQTSKACGLLEEALRLYPESEELRGQLAVSQQKLAREQTEREAEEQRRLRLAAGIAQAQALLDSGKPDEAIEAAEASLRSQGKHPQLQSLLEAAKAAAKQKKAEERKHAAQQKQVEEVKRRRNRDLAELEKLVELSASGINIPVLEKRIRRASELAGNHSGDQEFQASFARVKKALESAIDDFNEQKAETARTGLATEMFAPVQEARRTIGTVEERATAAAQPISELEPPRIRSELPVKWVVVAALGMVAVGAIVVKLLTAKTYTVQIATQPVGAQVRVGDRTCVTPNCRLDLPAGDYQISAQLQGYGQHSETLTVDPRHPEPTVRITLDLVSNPPASTQGSYLVVKTGVDGAEVLINGKKAAQSTSGGVLRVPLDPGMYRVEVEKSGYSPAKAEQAQVRKDAETTINFNLTLSPTNAGLIINGARPNAQVLADGHYLGLTGRDGSFARDVSPGRHEIVLSEDGRNSNAIAGNFLAGKSRNIDGSEFNFPQPANSTAFAVLRNLPPGASVKVDGRDADHADNSGVAQFEVAAGNHTLELTKDGFKSKSIQHSFNSGQTTLDGSMEPSADMLEAQSWKQANSTPDPKQIEEYLAKYPSGPHTTEAESRLQDLVWGLTNQGDVAALQGYVRRFHSGPHAEEASRLIENALWTRLDKQKPGALRDFLSQYPNSAHREEAQSFLTKIDLQGADKKAIQTALDKFNAAFEHHQTRELKQIWPAVTEQYLNPPAGYKVVLMLQQTGDAAISGDTAIVPCQVNSKTMKPGGQTTQNQKQTNLHLRKSGGGWLISSFGQ
ncbi:MAG TPA: protein kinase [Candidatus Sulfotelmatobacter sp.]